MLFEFYRNLLDIIVLVFGIPILVFTNWPVQTIIVIYLVIIAFKGIVKLVKTYPLLLKIIYVILLIIAIFICGYELRDESPYYFWNELLEKNLKPKNITFEEYVEKNKAGYCWRDRKYYTKEELLHKAMKSFTGLMIYKNKLYWDNKTFDMDGEQTITRNICERGKSCRVYRVPINLTNQTIKEYIGSIDSYEDYDDFSKKYREYDEKIKQLTDNYRVQSYIFASDKNFVNDDFVFENFILINNTPNRDEIYGSDCCTVLNKVEWSTISKKYSLAIKENEGGKFVDEARIPAKTNTNSWGVGNFYLGVKRVSYKKEDKVPEFPDDVYVLNNCGDVLYRPYYFYRNEE